MSTAGEREPIPEEEISTIQVSGEYDELSGGVHYTGGSNHYTRDETYISRIIDSGGADVKGVWEKEWTQIAPGIETRREDTSTRSSGGRQEETKTQTLRVRRSACPVTVKITKIFDYISYDSEFPGSSDRYDRWVRYVT